MSEGRILIVDDQPEIREYVRRIVEEKGYEVVEAEDGRAHPEVVERPIQGGGRKGIEARPP